MASGGHGFKSAQILGLVDLARATHRMDIDGPDAEADRFDSRAAGDEQHRSDVTNRQGDVADFEVEDEAHSSIVGSGSLGTTLVVPAFAAVLGDVYDEVGIGRIGAAGERRDPARQHRGSAHAEKHFVRPLENHRPAVAAIEASEQRTAGRVKRRSIAIDRDGLP